MKTFQTEFPDFPAADFPALPEGFTDSSWRNDVCPSMKNETFGLFIYVDYADAEKREHPTGERFVVLKFLADGSLDVEQPMLCTDDWAEVLAFIDSKRKPQLSPGLAQAGLTEAMGGPLARGDE